MTERAECTQREAARVPVLCWGRASRDAPCFPGAPLPCPQQALQVPAASRFPQDGGHARASSLPARPHRFCWGLRRLWLLSQGVWSCGFVFVIPLSSYPHPSDSEEGNGLRKGGALCPPAKVGSDSFFTATTYHVGHVAEHLASLVSLNPWSQPQRGL